MLVVALSCVLIKVPPRLAARPPPYHRPITTHPTNPRVTYPTDRDAASVLAVMLRYVLSGLRIRFYLNKLFALQGLYSMYISQQFSELFACQAIYVAYAYFATIGQIFRLSRTVLYEYFATVQQTVRLSRHVAFGSSIIRNTSLNCTPF